MAQQGSKEFKTLNVVVSKYKYVLAQKWPNKLDQYQHFYRYSDLYKMPRYFGTIPNFLQVLEKMTVSILSVNVSILRKDKHFYKY